MSAAGFEIAADIAVIGGGIAGLSLAAAIGSAARVVVLETEPALFHHTSSRSAEQMRPTYGPEPVRRLTLASITIVEDEIQAEAGPILSPRPLIWFTGEPDGAIDELLGEVAGLRRLTAGEACTALPALRRDRIHAAAIDDAAVEVQVPALLEWYRSRAVAAGTTIRTGARVLGASRSGDTWRLACADGTVTAPIVVDAAGAWADQLAGLFGVARAGLTPRRRTVVVVPSRGTPVDPAWPMAGDAADTIYFRPRGDAVLASSMEDEPSEPKDAVPRDEIVRRTIDRVAAWTTLDPGEPLRTWTGLRTLSADTSPVVGADPVVPGFYWLAGQGGYGIQTSAALSRLAAADLLGGSTPPDLAGVLADLAPRRASLLPT